MPITDFAPFTIIFPDWYDERAQYEATCKGYLPDTVVLLADGTRHRVYFVDPVRLGQNLEADSNQGNPYLAEPGMVVIPEVTTEGIRKAVAGLARDGFFQHLKPVS
jgi:hypothetical protein